MLISSFLRQAHDLVLPVVNLFVSTSFRFPQSQMQVQTIRLFSTLFPESLITVSRPNFRPARLNFMGHSPLLSAWPDYPPLRFSYDDFVGLKEQVEGFEDFDKLFGVTMGGESEDGGWREDGAAQDFDLEPGEGECFHRSIQTIGGTRCLISPLRTDCIMTAGLFSF